MEFVLVEKAKSPAYFKRVEKIYLDSFPVSQLRPTRMITRMLAVDPNYHLFVARQSDTLVGFTLVYAFNDLNTQFLDFMAIDRAYRNRGVGGKLFTHMVNISKQIVMNSIGLIFEDERERPMENNKDGFRHRRVLFYRRLEAKAFDNVHYMLPDLHGGKPQDMYLMIIPNWELAYLEKGFVFQIIKSIYLTIYHYYDELNFLELTIDGLPPKIKLL
jgi:GNAT superfamily N-acetyltransferase